MLRSTITFQRFLHWAMAIPMMLVLLTVALRKGWMSKATMGGLIEEGTAKIGYVISSEQGVMIAKMIRANMFEWHVYGGIAVGIFVLIRAYLYFKTLKVNLNSNNKISFYYKLQIFRNVMFFILVPLIALTGIASYYFEDYVPKIIETIHEQALWVIIPFLVLHLFSLFFKPKN